MIALERLAVCGVLALAGHLALARALEELPRHDTPPPPRKVEIRVVSRPPPEPPKELEPPPEPPKPPEPAPPVHEKPRSRPVVAIHQASVSHEAPPSDRPVVVAPTTGAAPVYGVTMESTSQAGTGPSVPVGNTLAPQPAGPRPATVAPLAPPVAAYEVTRMPLPQGRCSGKYTPEARQAAIEGTVVLDLTVGEDGRTRDIKVVSGLGHGLTEAAIAALRGCRFTPGEKEGRAVPVRVRGFKIRFVLAEAT